MSVHNFSAITEKNYKMFQSHIERCNYVKYRYELIILKTHKLRKHLCKVFLGIFNIYDTKEKILKRRSDEKTMRLAEGNNSRKQNIKLVKH